MFPDLLFRPVIQSTCPVPECPHTPGLWSPPHSGQDSPWIPTAHTRVQRCLLFLRWVSLSLGILLPRRTPSHFHPAVTVLWLFTSVARTWARARGLRLLSWSVEFLCTQSKRLSLETCAVLCRALGCEPCVTLLPADPARWAQKRAWQSFLSQEMLAEAYVQSVHHGVFYTNRKTVGSTHGIGKPLRYYTSLGYDCEAVFIKMLKRIITWKMLLA